MNFDEWMIEYRPVLNHFDPNASFDGLMFETEYEFVRENVLANKVWTYLEGDKGEPLLVSGYHFVNRLGYFVTEVPFNPLEHIEINLDD